MTHRHRCQYVEIPALGGIKSLLLQRCAVTNDRDCGISYTIKSIIQVQAGVNTNIHLMFILTFAAVETPILLMRSMCKIISVLQAINRI